MRFILGPQANPATNSRAGPYVWGVHEFKNTRDWGAWLAHGYLDMLNLTGYSYREQYGDKYLEVLDQRFADAEAVIRRLDKPVEFTICVGISTGHGKIRAASEVEDYLQIGKRQEISRFWPICTVFAIPSRGNSACVTTWHGPCSFRQTGVLK